MSQVEDAVYELVANPFTKTPDALAEAEKILVDADPRKVIDKHLYDGLTEDAKRTVLAIGHAQARREADPRKVLAKDVLPASVIRKLPRSRGAYLRIVMAAGRCARALSHFQGSSSLMREVRRATWGACFGDSLMHALTLEKVIEDHDVLILGETGTGKEAIAYAIQEGAIGADDGSPAPRSALNAAAVPETLVESELFGHVKRARGLLLPG
jgi:transcriptional regulator with PAS, ATPase and Fis domain